MTEVAQTSTYYALISIKGTPDLGLSTFQIFLNSTINKEVFVYRGGVVRRDYAPVLGDILLASRAVVWLLPEPNKGIIPNNAADQIINPALIRRISDGRLFLYTNGQAKLYSFNYSSIGGINSVAKNRNYDSGILVRTSSTLEPGSSKRQNLLSFGSCYNGIFQIPLADPPIQLMAGAKDNITHKATNDTSSSPYDPIEGSSQFHKGDFVTWNRGQGLQGSAPQ
ncbi:hypothetical protein BJ170DRAFT_600445 [Xylariales sp. AK1849]|nr:hypothetical protein BJ170DRAFT_600445 [Xylariales sp. AK1849]